jgi:hypothetical protein
MSAPASSGGIVTSIARRARYRPDYRGLASAQLLAAREELRMDHEEFAEYLSDAVGWPVFPASVSLWEQGKGTVPSDVYMAAGATAQDMTAAAAALHHDGSEEVAPYADRGLIGREQWNAIIRGSREHIWLYGMAEHGYADDDEVPGIMEAAAAAGCDVRVLLLDPAYPAIADIDAAEGKPSGTLVARISASVAKFAEMGQRCGGRMVLRAYDTHPTVSVVRGDDEMLITPYLRFSAGNNSPTLGITAAGAPGMFRRYSRHFGSMWDQARECR